MHRSVTTISHYEMQLYAVMVHFTALTFNRNRMVRKATNSVTVTNKICVVKTGSVLAKQI